MKKIFFLSFLFLLLFGYTQNAKAADACCVCNNKSIYRLQNSVDGCSEWCVSQGSTIFGSKANDAAFLKQYCNMGSNSAINTSGTSIPNPLGTTNINLFVSRIISYVLGLIGTVSLLLFIYGGLIWMTSAGSSDKVKKGRDILVWAVIGMAVVFTSYILVKFIIQGAQGVLK